MREAAWQELGWIYLEALCWQWEQGTQEGTFQGTGGSILHPKEGRAVNGYKLPGREHGLGTCKQRLLTSAPPLRMPRALGTASLCSKIILLCNIYPV